MSGHMLVGVRLRHGALISGGRLYWAEFGSNQIGRAALNGSEVETEFIREAGLVGLVNNLAISNERIYWTTQSGPYVGRAKLDGSEVETSWYHEPEGELMAVATSGDDLYWANCENEFVRKEEINRADLDTEAITFGFVPLSSCAHGIDVTQTHVYWANGTHIARSNLTGEHVEEFIEVGGFVLAVTVTEDVALEAQASPGVSIGGSIHDTATVHDGSDPHGRVTFRLYGPSDSSCSAAPVFSSEIAVAGDGSYPSASYAPTEAGTYRWTVSYSGDSKNEPADMTCGAEHQSAVVSAPAATAPADPASTPTPPAATSTQTASGRSAPKQCASARVESIHWKAPRGVELERIIVTIDGKRLRTLPGSARHSAVSLVGRGVGAVTVGIAGRTRNGARYTDTRTYHPCTRGTGHLTSAHEYLRHRRSPHA